MNHAYLVKTLVTAVIFLVIAQDTLLFGIQMSEVGQRIYRAEKNNDRSELLFLEETIHEEETSNNTEYSPDPSFAARVYFKLANLDESIEFMQRYYFNRKKSLQRLSAHLKFLEKATAEEKDATSETREKLFAFLLEIVQTSYDSVDVNRTDIFLLERMPEYAASKQRATLQRYANTGNDWTTNTFNPIKEHFDKIPPKQRPDLRDRFPSLPPLDEPPDESTDELPNEPTATPFPARLAVTLAAILLAVSIIILTVRRC